MSIILSDFSLGENYVAISPSVGEGRAFYPRFEMFLQSVVKIQFRNRVQPPEAVLSDRYRRRWRRPSFWKGGPASSQLHRGFVYLAICVKRGGSREKKSCAQALLVGWQKLSCFIVGTSRWWIQSLIKAAKWVPPGSFFSRVRATNYLIHKTSISLYHLLSFIYYLTAQQIQFRPSLTACLLSQVLI